jgi:hypothetical protein
MDDLCTTPTLHYFVMNAYCHTFQKFKYDKHCSDLETREVYVVIISLVICIICHFNLQLIVTDDWPFRNTYRRVLPG